MKENIQHLTFNTEPRMADGAGAALDVGRWMFMI
jgi:hypothetical protein